MSATARRATPTWRSRTRSADQCPGIAKSARLRDAGRYCFTSGALLTGKLTLNTEGNPAAVFIFQMGSTLITASGSSIEMINGGNSCNVYWQVGSSATLGTGSTFKGSIFALTSVTVTTGVTLEGRALVQVGEVTLHTSSVTPVE